MDEVREKKQELRNEVSTFYNTLSVEVLAENTRIIESRLFEFANFLESNISLLYVNHDFEVNTRGILARCIGYNKIVVLPAFNTDTHNMKLLKVDNLESDLKMGPRGQKLRFLPAAISGTGMFLIYIR